MGLFDRFLTGKEKEKEAQNGRGEAPGDVLYENLSRCAGQSRQFQKAFARVIEGFDWELDLREGIIGFGPHRFPIQVLGSEAQAEGTWLWSQENPSIPKELTTEAKNFVNFAYSYGMREIASPSFALTDRANGHNLAAMSACLRTEKRCYYRCPYSGGAAFVLVEGLPPAVFAPAPPALVATVFAETISSQALDHKLVLQGLLEANKATAAEETGQTGGVFAEGGTLRVRWDAQGHVAGIEAE